MIKFRKKNLMVCPGKTAVRLPSECLPYIQIKKISQNDYEFFDFDGFIVNFLKKESTALMIKREYSFDNSEEITSKSISNGLLIYESEKDLENWINFSKLLSVPLFIAVWPFDYPKNKNDELKNPLFIFEIIKIDSKVTLKLVQNGTEDTLKEFIRRYRNFSFKFVKPMTISKTYMDYYLSTTNDPWPGDLDGVIKRNKNGHVEALLEFKTHNLNNPISEESIDKYGKQDFRRFKVLYYLQEQIKKIQKFEPLILYIIWGTKESHKEVKIQVISKESVKEEFLVVSSGLDNYNNLYMKIQEIINANEVGDSL